MRNIPITYDESQTHAAYIYSREARLRALTTRHKYFLSLSRNLMNVAVELTSIERQLIKEGVNIKM